MTRPTPTLAERVDSLRRLKAEHAEMRDLLARLEWAASVPDGSGNRMCGVCGNVRFQGHTTDCGLSACLARLEGGAL